MTTEERLNAIPLGEALFTQRAIRRFKPDPIPEEVLEDIMQATIRAPNGGNNQQWRFILVKDAGLRGRLGELYREAWWAKRADAGIRGPEDIPPGKSSMRSAMRLAEEIGGAPVLALVCATAKGAQAAGSVIPISAPSGDELAHHYLWRFMRHLSRAGRVTIFDRSWYGRVLVERVEGLASEAEYARAYAEINDFEEQLVDHGILLVKFWLHISRGEQLRRFRERQRTPHKTWKMTREDWRNRRRWDDYERAVNAMVARTGARRAPWLLIEANDKLFARLKVIRTLAGRLERRLKQ